MADFFKGNTKKFGWILGTALVGILGFQNCGPAFEVQKNASLGESTAGGGDLDEGGQNTGAIPPVPTSPSILAPTAPLAVGMNAPFKVMVPIADPDTAVDQVTYVLKRAPAQGTLALDAGTVASATRGVTYTPRANFIGTDSFVLNVVDPQGNVGVDRTYEVRVEARGIGQMVGTFRAATCIPNTSPVVGTYVSTLTTFRMSETLYSVDCVTPILEHIMMGNHSIGAENVATLGGTRGFEYNVTNHQHLVRPLSVAAANALNQQNYCGFTGWVNNVSRNITASGCNGNLIGPNVYMYRRVEFPAAGSPRLFYSDLTRGGNGNTPQTRVQALLLTTVFVRD